MICDAFDVVDVPFPFSDRHEAKKRKALVLSERTYNEANSASVLMMITSAHPSTGLRTSAGSWQGDIPLAAWQAAGLKKPCIARVKLFTLDNALILGKIGVLATVDQKAVIKSLKTILPG